MSICICGAGSTIAKAILELLPEDEVIANAYEADRLLITWGFLAGQALDDISAEDATQTWRSNFLDPAQLCDGVIERNDNARICIIGSQSGYEGSYDMAYAGAKAAMHLYIEKKRLRTARQQLVGIAPTVIIDSRMTQARSDLALCELKGKGRRRGEWLSAMDVARLAHFLLYIDDGTITNTVIRQHGGNW